MLTTYYSNLIIDVKMFIRDSYNVLQCIRYCKTEDLPQNQKILLEKQKILLKNRKQKI